ncbi:histidine kinase [Murimonas intestini]|nr:histidine kinase [Murimonas intestini]
MNIRKETMEKTQINPHFLYNMLKILTLIGAQISQDNV